MLEFILKIPRNIGKLTIRLYQKLLSFDHAFWAKYVDYRVCIHEPSCSEYTYQAVDKFGLVLGSIMGFARIMRCNPYSKGGYDPLPDKFSLKANYQEHQHHS